MNKTRNLTIQCVAVFVMFLGIGWWVGREYERAYPEPVKTYQGRWVEDMKKVGDFWSVGYLEVMGK